MCNTEYTCKICGCQIWLSSTFFIPKLIPPIQKSSGFSTLNAYLLRFITINIYLRHIS